MTGRQTVEEGTVWARHVRTYFEIRWSPESYYPGLRVPSRPTAEAVVAEIRRRLPDIDEVSVHEILVHDGAVGALAGMCLDGWAEATPEFDLPGYAPADEADTYEWAERVTEADYRPDPLPVNRRLGQPGHEPSEQPEARAAWLQKRSKETLDRAFGQSPWALPAQEPREAGRIAVRVLRGELIADDPELLIREVEKASAMYAALRSAGARVAGDAGLREAAIATLRDYHLVAFDSGHDHPIEQCHLPIFKERLALFAAARDDGAGLDAAWRAVELLLPEGWRPVAVCATDDDWQLWQAATCSPAFFDGETSAETEQVDGFGATPAAALNALAARLRAAPERAEIDVERLRNVVYDALRAEIRRDNEQPMHVLAEHIAENAAAAYKALQTPGAPGSGDGE